MPRTRCEAQFGAAFWGEASAKGSSPSMRDYPLEDTHKEKLPKVGVRKKRTTVYWPHNTMLYATLRGIKATMPKPGTGRFSIPKPTNPNGKTTK